MFNIKEFKKNMLFLMLAVLVVIVGFFVSTKLKSNTIVLKEQELDNDGAILTSKLLISELMTSNDGSYTDEFGKSYDWVELYNGSNSKINLKNYALSDNKKTVKWVFPDVIIDANSYLVVFLSGINDEGLYANFKLKSSGSEDLILVNKSGKVIDGVTTSSLDKNEVMFRDNNGEWQRSKKLTPGYANTLTGYAEFEKNLINLEEKLIITEVLPRNKGNFKNFSDDYDGYIELTNNTNEIIDLNNYSIGSSLTRAFQYSLPEAKLKAGDSVVIYTSGKNEIINDEIHASFKLDSENGIVTLGRGNKIVNFTEYTSLANGMALIYIDKKYEISNTISPGYANTESGIKEFSEKYLSKPKKLIINEIMNYNTSYLPHNGNNYYDWIELYNNTTEDIALKEYYLTTNMDSSSKWNLPDITLKSGEYYIIMASGNVQLSTSKYKHANFKISDVESIYLTKDSKIVDSMFVANVPLNYSIGRGDYGLYYYATATPLANNGSGKREVAYSPIASVNPGIYNDVEEINLALSSHGTIYYTLDGSKPTKNSKAYKGPISLKTTTTIKTLSTEDNKYNSEIKTYTYIINEEHSLDVFMISMNPKDFQTMQQNPNTFDYEKEAYAEFFEQDGNSFSIPCSIKLFGGSTRFLAKKSYAIKFKSQYGEGKLNYKVFANRDYSSYDSLILRSGSQDYKRAFFRDVLMTSLIDGQTSVMVQAYRPTILYINGEYYGIYNIRERIDEDFIANNQNVTTETTNIIKIDREIRSGSIVNYDRLLNYLNTHNMALKTNYEYIKTQINVQDIADFWIAETWVTNNDIVNTRYYQNSYFDNNRWHAIFFDLDYAMYNVKHNYFSFSTASEGMTINGYSTTILRNLLKNSEFRLLYLERIAYQVKNIWNEERVLKYIDNLHNLYYPEMSRNQKRWGLTMSTWESEVEKLRVYAKKRNDIIISQAESYFNMSKSEIEKYFGDL